MRVFLGVDLIKKLRETTLIMVVNVTQSTFFTIILCILVIYAAYIFLYYTFDERKIISRNSKMKDKLRNSKLQSLLDGSGINNIPNLEIITNNEAITIAAACAKGPVSVADAKTDADCIRVCANSSAHHLAVNEGETTIYDSDVLNAGSYCTIGPRPRCNMSTSIAMMTVNSIICRPRYPDLVGGPTGNTLVACNNSDINDPKNQLWDYRDNIKFDPFLQVQAIDVNEKLDSGEYRYRCRFNGYDEHQNLYVEHPNNRFHPFRNYCASELYMAHPDVQMRWNPDTQSMYCDCGDYHTTRVKNIIPDDPTSLCATHTFDVKTDVRNRKILTQPYRCFNMFSNVTDVGKYMPCPGDAFTTRGSQFATVEIPFTHTWDALIEHPIYKDFDSSDAGVVMGDGYITW